MGVNHYLFRKVKFDENVPYNIGCDDWEGDSVIVLDNGYAYRKHYYPTIEELNDNYYQKIHIGKSSFGWHYLLCVYPELGINTIDDWKTLFDDETTIIKDEYGEEVRPDDMYRTITDRASNVPYSLLEKRETELVESHNKMCKEYNIGRGVSSYDELLRDNHAQRGLNGLWKHMEDKYITNTDGTYDYIVSGENGVDFS